MVSLWMESAAKEDAGGVVSDEWERLKEDKKGMEEDAVLGLLERKEVALGERGEGSSLAGRVAVMRMEMQKF